MKKLLALPLIALASTTASMASAQSGPDLQFSGVVMLGTQFSDGSHWGNYGYANIEADYTFATLASGTKIGLSFDFERLQTDRDTNDISHLGLYADFGNHRVTAGVIAPSFGIYSGRSVADNSGYPKFVRGMSSFGGTMDILQTIFGRYAMGARYDGQFGAFDVSASYSQYGTGGIEIGAGSASVRYTFSEAISVWASVEKFGFSFTPTTTDSYAVGLTGNVAAFEYSLAYSNRGDFGDEVLEASVFYDVNDNIELGLGMINQLSGASFRIAGSATASYTIGERYFISGTITSFDTGRTDGSLDIGIKF